LQCKVEELRAADASVPIVWAPLSVQAPQLPCPKLIEHAPLFAVADMVASIERARDGGGILVASAESVKALLLRHVDLVARAEELAAVPPPEGGEGASP